MARLAIFLVFELRYTFEFEICERGDPLDSETVGKVGHNLGLWLESCSK